MITINDINIFEWDLKLDNREILLLSEVSLERVRDDIRVLLESKPSLLNLVPRIPVDIVEQAKIGYHPPFLKMLKGDPIKSFVSIGGKSCSYVKSCATSSIDCYLPKVVRTLPNFPECFYYGNELVDQLLNEFVRHWKLGRRVIITY
jgi:hypothetical protein